MSGLIAIASIFMVSCGARVEVPIAHVGKIKTATGLMEGLKYPSTFRLPVGFTTKPELIIAETSHFAVSEQMSMFMPKDKLNLTFEVKATMFIDPDKSEELFSKLNAIKTEENRVLLISAQDVYRTYGQQIVQSKVRTILSKYSIEDIMNTRETINTELSTEVSKMFTDKKYPIGVIQFDLADVKYPDVIIKAQELSKEREVQIQTAEAQKMVQLKEAEAQLEVAKKQQEIDLLEAETQVLVEQKMSEAVSDAFVTQRSLKILDKMADNPSKTFLIPMEAFQNPSLMTGVYNKTLNE